MSFLKIGDRAAGAIKSGGTTRRAAKMVVGRRRPSRHRGLHRLEGEGGAEGRRARHRLEDQPSAPEGDHGGLRQLRGLGRRLLRPDKNPALKREIKAARKRDVPDGYIKRVIQFARRATRTSNSRHYDTDWDSEAYLTVSGQNSNNTVRVTDEFLQAVENRRRLDLTRRTDGKVAKTLKARDLWEKIGYAAWASRRSRPAIHTTINDWHTCPASGPINASNPCSEYMFLDDTACNLASLNLLQFRDRRDAGFRRRGYEHAVRLWTLVLEISVLMAQFPSRRSRGCPTTTARSASATPISAGC
jgi:ribonucleoside-diphosphate reductase alpha chain